MKLVDKNSQIPLYIQLSEIIKEMINNKELQEGHYLMSERDICKIQDISRMTVNKAIMHLVNEGILERRQGKGTFISYKKQKLTYERMQGFTEIAKYNNLNVRNEILKFELSKPSNKVNEYLKLKNDNLLVFQIERIRFVDDEPTILEKIYIPQYMCLIYMSISWMNKRNRSIFLHRMYSGTYNQADGKLLTDNILLNAKRQREIV